MNKWAPTLLLTPLYIAFVTTVYWFFLSLSPPVTINKLDINTHSLAAGEIMDAQWDVTWHRACTYHVERYIKNGGLTHLESFDVSWPKGHESRLHVEIIVPKTQRDGSYEFVTNSTAVCNILDYVFPIHIDVPNIPFTVNNDPVGEHYLTLITPIISPGEPITFQFYFDRKRQCYSNLTRFVYDANNILVYENERAPHNDIGERTLIEKMQLPVLPSGDYILKTNTNYQCSDGNHLVEYNDLHFTIK